MLRRSLWALIHPLQATAAIRADERPSYPRLVPTLMLGGLFFIVLHTRFVIGHWVWDLGYWPLILVQFMFVGLWVWLIGVFVLVVTFGMFARRRPTIGQIEIGVVYLWMSFCIMPVLDVVHLFGVPTVALTERLHWQHFLLAHVSLLLTSPLRMILVYGLLRSLGDMPRVRAWLLAFVLSFGARFVVEPSGGLLFSWGARFGITPHFWIGQFVLVVGTLIALLLWRWWWQTRSWPRTFAAVTPIAAALILLSLGTWQLSWSASLPGAKPAPVVLPAVHLAALPARITSLGPRWERATSTSAPRAPLTATGDFLDGRDHQVRVVVPLAVVMPDSLERLDRFECRAELMARDGRGRDRLPWIRCDLVDQTGHRWLAGAAVENAAGAVQYRMQWRLSESAEAGLLDALAAGTVRAEFMVGVRGGGDYTNPDRLDLVSIVVLGDRASEGGH